MSYRRDEFKPTVLALDRDCIMARRDSREEHAESPCEGNSAAHHVITQQQLRKRGLHDLLWDPSNGVRVCERHHRRHHNRNEPISETRLPQRCLDFIARHGLERLLDRYYDA